MGTGAEGRDGGQRCELTVRGPLARSVVAALRARFDVESTPGPGRAGQPVDTVLTVDGADQAAVRALMTMLWDSGHEVLAMSTGGGCPS